jgi:FKBP-type peptidyl-prolyl cis-trans isomerase FklB
MVLLGTAAAQQTPTTTTTPAKPKTSTGTTTTHKSTTATAARRLPLVTEKDKQSYAIGLSVGRNLTRDMIDVEPKFVLQGMQDELNKAKPQLTDDQLKQVMVALQTEVQKKVEAKRAADLIKNKKDGDAFLAANKAKPGVVTLPDGLQYKILTPGTGAKPTATDTVVVNYRGTLIDGTEFDSSYKRGTPATFQVGRVIKGWTEALQLMPAGSKWQIVIPSDLAYGERGQSTIGPNSTLIFDVELVSIQPKPPAPAATTPPAGTTPPPASATPPPSSAAPASTPPPTSATPPPSTPPPASTPPPTQQ